MMAKDFEELSARIKAKWSDDDWKLYDAVSAQFKAEVDERIALGNSVASARKSRDLTQAEVSAATGIQQSEISRIERGVGNPTAATLLRIAEALGQRLTLTPLGDA